MDTSFHGRRVGRILKILYPELGDDEILLIYEDVTSLLREIGAVLIERFALEEAEDRRLIEALELVGDLPPEDREDGEDD